MSVFWDVELDIINKTCYNPFKVVVHEKTKVDGHYRQTVEIYYNFVGAIDRPVFGNEINN